MVITIPAYFGVMVSTLVRNRPVTAPVLNESDHDLLRRFSNGEATQISDEELEQTSQLLDIPKSLLEEFAKRDFSPPPAEVLAIMTRELPLEIPLEDSR